MVVPDTSLQPIIDYLTGRIGLDPGSIGKETVERALHKRMHAVHAASAESYLARVKSSDGELERLIDAVAVPETWFFRDSLVFPFVTRWVAHEWKPAFPSAVLRILCLPCSSGEEPYSIAMALLDSNVPADRLDIEAIDLREPALQKARLGIYSRNSFRGDDLEFRDRYFDHVKEGFQIRNLPFDRIRFRPGNILEPGLLDANAFDIIFCRNLLIYFDLQAKKQALANVKKALRRDGVLFVGHSETLWVSSQPGFAIVPEPHVFAVRQDESVATKKSHITLPTASVRRTASRISAAPSPRTKVRSRRESKVEEPQPAKTDLLAVARDCANRGDVAKARESVDQSIQSDGPSAEAFLLLGLLSTSEGRHAEAARLFEKALYLQPGHEEALTLLALEKERSGDSVAARRLRDRLKRITAASRAGSSLV
ncbi:MAG TPA: CheR family methyltransferase [Thermoanaerobaculia bacterium]|nr:CheR family methyltransferase [Thermoanaerobaculia bacterium]